MARSKAQKQRSKLVREGKLDPVISRKDWHGCRPVERVIPTYKETKNRLDNKHKKKWNLSSYTSEGSIFYCRTTVALSAPYSTSPASSRPLAYKALPTTPASSSSSAGLICRSRQ